MSNNNPLFTPNPPGAGPVSVAPASDSQGGLTGFGISSQLIIWGMVAFILCELLAIICLLRYCCRARYLKRRKYKEKEITLSDRASDQGYANQYPNVLDQSQLAGPGINSAIGVSSVNSLRPILFSQGQLDNNDTVMVDDIMSIYSNNYNQQKAKNTKNPPIEIGSDSNDSNVVTKLKPKDSATNITIDYTERMRQELSNEDIYTLRFSTSVPIEPFDSNAPKQQQSYLYNGSMSRPAFEIISHADVRPATPVHFEQAKELSTTKIINKRWTEDLAALDSHRQIDEEFIYNEKRSFSPSGLESTSWLSSKQMRPNVTHRARSNTSPIPIRLSYGHEESVRNTGEPVEWQEANELRTTDWDRLKGFASSSNSNPPSSSSVYRYSNIDETTTTRDTNNRYSNNRNTSKYFDDTADSYDNYSNIRHSTIGAAGSSSGGRAGGNVGSSNKNRFRSASNGRAHINDETFNAGEQSNKRIYSSDTNLLDNDDNISSSSTSSSNSSSSRFNSLNKKLYYINSYYTYDDPYTSNNKKINKNKKSDYNDLFANKWKRYDDNHKQQQQQHGLFGRARRGRRGSGRGSHKHRTNGRGKNDEIVSEKSGKGKSTNIIATTATIDSNTDKQQPQQQHEQQQELIVDTNGQSSVLTKIIRDPDTNEILSIKRINESNLTNNNNSSSNLNIKQIESSPQLIKGHQQQQQQQQQRNEFEEENVLDRSNISIIEVTYPQSPRTNQFSLDKSVHEENDLDFEIEKEIDENDLPSLPPPLQFQQNSDQLFVDSTQIDHRNGSSKPSSVISIVKVIKNDDDGDGDGDTNASRRRSSNKSDKSSRHQSRRESTTNSIRKEESEDFSTSHEININLDHDLGYVKESEELMSAESNININNNNKKPPPIVLGESFKRLDKINNLNEETHHHQHQSFHELNESFLKESSKELDNLKRPITPSFNDLIKEIRGFNTDALRSTSKFNEPLIYENNPTTSDKAAVKESATTNQQSNLTGIPQAPPLPSNFSKSLTTSNNEQQQTKSKNENIDRISISSSTVMSTNSAHLY